MRESRHVNGVKITGVCARDLSQLSDEILGLQCVTDSADLLYENCDAVYIISKPESHFQDIKASLEARKHVLCESPITLSVEEYDQLSEYAKRNGLILMDGIKTAYSTAFNRMILLVKGGVIGDIVSVDAVCTSLRNIGAEQPGLWNSMSFWATTAMLPIFDILGTDYKDKQIASRISEHDDKFDLFSKITFVYPHAVASLKIGQGVKSEGELIISGTKGYVYVPAPWWKTDYFEVRYENQSDNKRFFYKLEGEGIRFEILSFIRQIENGAKFSYIGENTSRKMIEVVSDFYKGDFVRL